MRVQDLFESDRIKIPSSAGFTLETGLDLNIKYLNEINKNKLYRSDGFWPEMMRDWKDEYRHLDKLFVYLRNEKEELIGIAYIIQIKPQWGLIGTFVNPQYRKQGLSKVLLQKLFQLTRNRPQLKKLLVSERIANMVKQIFTGFECETMDDDPIETTKKLSFPIKNEGKILAWLLKNLHDNEFTASHDKDNKYINIAVKEPSHMNALLNYLESVGINPVIRFHESLFESKDLLPPKQLEKLTKMILQKCKPYLKAKGDNELYRGMIEVEPLTIIKPYRDAYSNKEATKYLGHLMTQDGFKATRANAIFCFSNPEPAGGHGDEIVVVYPVGDYSLTTHKLRYLKKDLGDGRWIDLGYKAQTEKNPKLKFPTTPEGYIAAADAFWQKFKDQFYQAKTISKNSSAEIMLYATAGYIPVRLRDFVKIRHIISKS